MISNPKAAIEAVLFAMGNSVEFGTLAKALETEVSEVRSLVQEMADDYSSSERGIEIIILEDACQLCTKKDYYEQLIRIAMHPKKITLTDVMLETLSIIAYKQPVTKAEIEKIRGVKCDHAVNKLIEYDLVKELGRLDAPGRPILFGTTEEFLRSLGVENTDDLPSIDPVKLADFKAEAEEEIQVRVDV